MSYVVMNYRDPDNERKILEEWELYENQRLSSNMFKVFVNSMFEYAVNNSVKTLDGMIAVYRKCGITIYDVRMDIKEVEAGCYSAYVYVNDKFIRKMVISE